MKDGEPCTSRGVSTVLEGVTPRPLTKGSMAWRFLPYELYTVMRYLQYGTLQQLSLIHISFEQQKEVERSERYDDTDELQQSWGIFDSGDSVTEYRSEAIREVRKNEESVPQGEQTDDLQRHDLDRNTVSAPLGSGRNSEQENGSADEPRCV